MGRRRKASGEREIEILAARVRYEIYKEVGDIAKKEGLTLTQVVRKAVIEYVARVKRPKAAA